MKQTLQTLTAPLIHLSRDFIRAKEYFEAIVASTSDAICTTDTEGRVIYFSPGAESMLGVRMTDAAGRPAHEFYAGGPEESRSLMRRLRREGVIKNHEMALKASNGCRIHVSMSASLLRDRDGRVIGTMGISKDITNRVDLENRLRELSITDNLTGLHNQRCFRERLVQEASRAKRQRYKLSLILMDLDGFKRANDLFGHLEGDRILHEFAVAIEKGIRGQVDTAYRYGGDEFVVLLPGLDKKGAEKAAQRIVGAAVKTVARSKVGCSYGVATLMPKETLDGFLQRADKAMFEMKSARNEVPRARAKRRTK